MFTWCITDNDWNDEGDNDHDGVHHDDDLES